MLSEIVTQVVPLGASAIDIGEWLFSLSDQEYQATSLAHLGSGTSRAADGRRCFFDTERFGPVFIVNHHVEEEARRDYVRVRSRDSRGWLLGLLPLALEVCWEMTVHDAGPDRCELECALHIGLSSRALERVAAVSGTPALQRAHVAEQTAGFAQSVLATYGRPHDGSPAPPR